MSKDETILILLGLLITNAWLVIFKSIDMLYYITLSIYMALGFLIIGYLDYKRSKKINAN